MASSEVAASAFGDDTIVQYILVRKDLKGPGWTKGALIAQACHASVAAVWLTRDDESTIAYVSADGLASMHKIVVGADSEEALLTAQVGVRRRVDPCTP